MLELAAFLLIALYVAFVLTMRFKLRKEQRGYLTTKEKLIAYPVLAVGYPLDVLVNLTIASVLFLDPPKELTVSDRLERYIFGIDGRYGWREGLAMWIDDTFIQPHDEGHIND